MKTRGFRVLAAALAALLPACGGGGHGSGGEPAGPAFPVMMTEPKAGLSFTAPATISISAVAADPANVAKVEFIGGVLPDPISYDFFGGTAIATLTQPPFQATWTGVTAGIHTIVAIVTDPLGARTFSNTVTITVLPPGESPAGWMPIARLWGAPMAMSFINENQGWVAGLYGDIQHTEDGGATWVLQAGNRIGCTQCPDLLDIQFIDAGRGWAVGAGSMGGVVLRTTDGGRTWTSSSLAKETVLWALSFVDAEAGWVVGSSDTVFATKDGGMTWTPLPTGVPDNVINRAVRFVDRQSGWVAGSAQTPEGFVQGIILHTTDGGLTWTEQLRTAIGEEFRAMDFVSAMTGWVSRTGGPEARRILSTSDGGATWTEQAYPAGDPIFALDFVSPTQGWGGGEFGAIIHTDDGAQTWVTQPDISLASGMGTLDMQFIDAHRGWALRGLLFRTTTGGKKP